MILLDVLYLLSSDFYKKKERGSFKFSGVVLLSAAFLFNVILISFIIIVFKPEWEISIYNSRYYTIVTGMVTFMLLLHIRYFKITSYGEVSSKFNAMSDTRKSIYNYIGVLYLIFSFVSTIVCAVWIGSHRP